jgi:hypothetical protein
VHHEKEHGETNKEESEEVHYKEENKVHEEQTTNDSSKNYELKRGKHNFSELRIN